MTRAKCKHGDHWANREDCILVNRKVGGSYRRAASYKPTLICLECAGPMVERIETDPDAYRGQMTTSQWNISNLRYNYRSEMLMREREASESETPTA